MITLICCVDRGWESDASWMRHTASQGYPPSRYQDIYSRYAHLTNYAQPSQPKSQHYQYVQRGRQASQDYKRGTNHPAYF